MDVTWRDVEKHLQDEKKRIYEAITNYPPPIPACDAQFNYLLERRTKLFQELNRLADISKVGSAQSVEDFIRESSFFDDDTVQVI